MSDRFDTQFQAFKQLPVPSVEPDLTRVAHKFESTRVSLKSLSEAPSPRASMAMSPRDEGQGYYFKYIHKSNRDLVLRNSLDEKVKSYMPFEAGRKIPIKERVEYYMQKLEQTEDGKKEKEYQAKIQEVIDSRRQAQGRNPVYPEDELEIMDSFDLDDTERVPYGDTKRKSNLPSLIRNMPNAYSIDVDKKQQSRSPKKYLAPKGDWSESETNLKKQSTSDSQKIKGLSPEKGRMRRLVSNRNARGH